MTRDLLQFTRCLAAAALVLAVGACTAEVAEPADYTVAVGQQFDITLHTVGPDAYDSIPAISSPIVRFLDASVVPPYDPGGPNQRFRFEAQAPGRAIITFRRSTTSPVVSDMVVVEVH
jgi:hypothetical protein